MTENAKAIDFLLSLGPVEKLMQGPISVNAAGKDFYCNAHIHLPPNFSAFDTIEQALTMCDKQNVRVIGVNNYYDFTLYDELSKIARQKAILPLFGTEIIALEKDLVEKTIRVNDGVNPGKYYIGGKGITKFDQLSQRARELFDGNRNNDAQRMSKMTGKLSQLFTRHGVNITLDDKAVIDRVVERHLCPASTVTLQERHLAQAFQQVFFEKVPTPKRNQKLTEIFGATPCSEPDDAVSIQNEIRSFLIKAGKSCFVEETFVTLSQAKELICQLGGISCYPVLADGTDPICEYEYPLDDFISTLKDNNFSMVEFITVRNSPQVLLEYATAIRKAGIVVVAGTEHNTLDMIPLKPLCAGKVDIPNELEEIFYEGICVIAAHQFLCANGKCGFVDSAGMPNPAYSCSEERIESFSKLGEKVIEKYFRLS